MTAVARLWVAVAIAGLVATTSVPRGWYGAAAAASARVDPAFDFAQAREGATSIQTTPVRGGSLVATMRSEPRTFNPHAGRDFASSLVIGLTHARLLRVNRATQQLEPWLAEKYACSPDGLTCTLKLRRGVTFSDGAPFTSADVLFSFQAAYDEKTGSPLGDALLVGGKPSRSRRPTRAPSSITFPSVFGPGLRLLDMLPILPKHKLDAALKAGTLRQQWGPATPPAEIAGLGPVRDAGVPARRAPRARAQPALLAQGRRRRAAAVPRPAHPRDRARPERRTAAAAVGAGGPHAERDPARRLRRAQARGRGREDAPGGRGPGVRRRRVLVQPEARREGARRPAVARARGAAARRVARREPPRVRRRGVPGRGRAAVGPGVAVQQGRGSRRRAPSSARPTTWAARACCWRASACATRTTTACSKTRRARPRASRSSRRRATPRSRRARRSSATS